MFLNSSVSTLSGGWLMVRAAPQARLCQTGSIPAGSLANRPGGFQGICGSWKSEPTEPASPKRAARAAKRLDVREGATAHDFDRSTTTIAKHGYELASRASGQRIPHRVCEDRNPARGANPRHDLRDIRVSRGHVCSAATSEVTLECLRHAVYVPARDQGAGQVRSRNNRMLSLELREHCTPRNRLALQSLGERCEARAAQHLQPVDSSTSAGLRESMPSPMT